MGWLLLGQATVSRSVQEQSKDYPRAARYTEKRRGTKIIRAIKQGEWEMEAEEKAIIFPHSSQPWKWQWKAWVCCHKEEKKRQVNKQIGMQSYLTRRWVRFQILMYMLKRTSHHSFPAWNTREESDDGLSKAFTWPVLMAARQYWLQALPRLWQEISPSYKCRLKSGPASSRGYTKSPNY